MGSISSYTLAISLLLHVVSAIVIPFENEIVDKVGVDASVLDIGSLAHFNKDDDESEVASGFKIGVMRQGSQMEVIEGQLSPVNYDDSLDKSSAPYEPADRNARAILGSDDRVSAAAVVGDAPWKYYVCITYKNADGSAPTYPVCQCTGVLVSNRHILTAGHCLHAGDNATWYDIHKVYFKVDKGSKIDDGTCLKSGVSEVYVPNDWIENGAVRQDFGLIKVFKDSGDPKEFPGDRLGWMSFGFNNAAAVGDNYVLAGYPADKIALGRDEPWLWASSGNITAIIVDRYRHNLDTVTGVSGAGLYNLINSTRVVQAIHTKYNSVLDINIATTITADFFTVICDWIDLTSGSGVC